MLFDDPVDNSGQSVSELSIPAPVDASKNSQRIPDSAEQVLASQEPEPFPAEPTGDTLESTGALEEVTEEPEKQGASDESLYTESEGYTQGDASTQDIVEQPDDIPIDKHPKPRQKQPIVQPSNSTQSKPLSADEGVFKNVTPKTQAKETHVEPALQESQKTKKIVETVKPAIIKKPDIAPPLNTKESAAKISDIVKEQESVRQAKPSAAKSIAAAVADAKQPEATLKTAPKLVRWYIQLGSFSKKENALSLWDSLREQGLPASLDTVQTDKGVSYRLRVGPELDGKKAAAMKARLDKQNIKAILMSE
jgi:DedD protein